MPASELSTRSARTIRQRGMVMVTLVPAMVITDGWISTSVPGWYTRISVVSVVTASPAIARGPTVAGSAAWLTAAPLATSAVALTPASMTLPHRACTGQP